MLDIQQLRKDLPAVVDHAIQAVGQAQGVQVTMPATGGGEGATVDSAALDELLSDPTSESIIVAGSLYLVGEARSLLLSGRFEP